MGKLISGNRLSLIWIIIASTIIIMKITSDPNKRIATLNDRGIDFADAIDVFSGGTLDFQDDRKDYGETRIITIGHLRDRMMVIVWTPLGDSRHIISKESQ